MQLRDVFACVLVLWTTSTEAFKTQSHHVQLAEDAGNPIRKVVAMMEKMAKKIEEEGKSEEDLYEKFECYCKKTTAELEESISMAVSSPMTQADIDSRKAEVDSLEAEVKKLKDDRIAEEDTLKAAEAQRQKEHQQYEEEHQEDLEVVASITQASQALKGGSALLQADKSRMLRAAQHSSRLDGPQKQQIMSLLSGEAAKTDPDYVMGILSAMKDDTKEKITSEDKFEANAVDNFGDLEESKKTEISTLLEQLERKMKRQGELKVEIVDLEHSLAGSDQALTEDRAMLAELKSTWTAKAAAHEERKAMRSKELVALQDTIKLLDSDKSLDLFRGRASFLQTSKDVRKEEAKKLLSKAAAGNPELNFLALALSGKQVDFSKIVEKIDGMVALLKTEQKDDETKKAYCQKQFHESELKSHGQQQDLASLAASIAQKAEATKLLAGEVKSLQDGVAAMDKSIATAGENRKAEHAEFSELIASDTSAVDLLEMAKKRLAKVYQPAPATALLATNASLNEHLLKYGFDAPPPTAEGDYKAQQSYGVLSMMDTLKADLEQEMSLAKMEEGNAQKTYEETLADAAKKREADLSLIAEKSKNKADLEMDLDEDKADSKGKKKEALATADFVKNLHAECDWLLQNFDLRAEARVDEKENLVRAKTVLSGGTP